MTKEEKEGRLKEAKELYAESPSEDLKDAIGKAEAAKTYKDVEEAFAGLSKAFEAVMTDDVAGSDDPPAAPAKVAKKEKNTRKGPVETQADRRARVKAEKEAAAKKKRGNVNAASQKARQRLLDQS